MTKGLFTFPHIASLGITPYVLDLKGALAPEFTYTRPTEDEVLNADGTITTRAPNVYVPEFSPEGVNLGMRFTPGEDQLLWKPSPGLYTIYIEHGDFVIDIRTVLIGEVGLVVLPATGKTHIRRIGVNRELDIETPTTNPPDQLPQVSLPTELVVAEGQTLTIVVNKLGVGPCTVSISAQSGEA